ncbi:MAG: hypothetical protein JW701_04995 [Kosmotogaceae bacterium]|nr:hypothetical protein [Kosmotogaceae bacterium]
MSHCTEITGYLTATKSIRLFSENTAREIVMGFSLAVIDRKIEEWEGQLDKINDFIETKSVDPTRMARRLGEVQDKIEELKKTRMNVEGSQWARKTE